MENKSNLKDKDEKRYIETDSIINVYFNKVLKNSELKNKYLDLLNQRLDENKKSLNILLMMMFFIIVAFPLILETKISEISIGPFKLRENSFALCIMPSIFAFCHYKAVQIHLLLNRQKRYYRGLTSVLFNHRQYSVVSNIIKPYSFLDSTHYYHFTENSKVLVNFLKILWAPIQLGIIFLPYWFIYTTIKTLYYKYGLDNIQEIMFFLVPILLSFFTIILIIQDIKRMNRLDKEMNEEEEMYEEEVENWR